MSKKTLKLLRIGALVLGWMLLVTVLLGVWGRFNVYLHPTYDPQFRIIRALSIFFSGLGNVFFAFLIAAVLRMIEKEAPVGRKNVQRLMIICCLSYLADAIVRSWGFFLSLSAVTYFFNNPDWISLLPNAYIGLPPFAPFLYAASIFVLFTHFTKMVTFESEVA